jgi:hypothetical protein
MLQTFKPRLSNCDCCGAKLRSFNVSEQHTNGHWNERYTFECGMSVNWSPNFMDFERHGHRSFDRCPRHPEVQYNKMYATIDKVIAQLNQAQDNMRGDNRMNFDMLLSRITRVKGTTQYHLADTKSTKLFKLLNMQEPADFDYQAHGFMDELLTNTPMEKQFLRLTGLAFSAVENVSGVTRAIFNVYGRTIIIIDYSEEERVRNYGATIKGGESYKAKNTSDLSELLLEIGTVLAKTTNAKGIV